jgi:short subunit dehydrogenase-like uncharacterized protein
MSVCASAHVNAQLKSREMPREADYDIVLFGATGFTGELTAQVLLSQTPPGARWALAGRSQSKLAAVRERLAAIDPAAAELPLLTADVADPTTLEALAASSRVLISTVGPYLRHGEALVAACAKAGTDYVDLCGEPEFVDLMYLRYHQLARESGARLVHSCGFDSVPYDLGALFTIGQIPEAAQVPIALEGFALAKGSVSGGTYHSLVGALGRVKESGRASRQRRSVERHAADGKLAEGRRVRGTSRRPHKDRFGGGWVVAVPTIDPQQVLRTARLDERYGPDFSYAHYIVVRKLRTMVGLGVVVGLVAMLAQIGPTRKVLLKLKRQGSGPNEAKRARAFFRVRFRAQVGGEEARVVTTEVSGGDPGYGETAKILAQSALCLAFDEVPAPGGGQWSPALALGQPLIDRLIKAGIVFRVV